MIKQITRENWKEFFDSLSGEMLDWETTVQVLDGESGAQTLSEGLPFGGLTLENKNCAEKIGLMVGAGTGNHQTHNIFQPKTVAYEIGGGDSTSVLDIEEENGTKTLIKFTQPLPTIVGYSETAMVSRAFSVWQGRDNHWGYKGPAGPCF